ncbi:MAG: hypothetical protein KF899_00515 [Parvibaculum sp.]|nr:hypothetical protein [Parvibaculum sp.]
MFRPFAAAILATLFILPAHPPAEAASFFGTASADKLIAERTTAAWRKIGTGDLYRFNMLQKDLIAGEATAAALEEGMALGRRWLDKEPVFAGSVFGLIARAPEAAQRPAAPLYSEALYWNAIAYDRICERDGELCQALAASILSGEPGAASLKASALRYINFANAAAAAGALPPGLAADAAAKCRTAHEVLKSRAARDARDTQGFYAEQLQAACGAARTAAAP